MWHDGQHLLMRSENPHGKDLLIKEIKDRCHMGDGDGYAGDEGKSDDDADETIWRSPTQNDEFVNAKLANVMKLMAKQVSPDI